jgi:predicted metal-dependent enzyme (double-stranded beta helix superfamily)
MFDVDAFVEECLAANGEAEPRLAIKEVLDRAVSRPEEVADALPPSRAGIGRLHVTPELTILNVVWTPGMKLWPHDHRMWATIGIYTGGEDNAFYRRDASGLATSGGRELRPADTVLLGSETIHSVTNPTEQFAGALHIYGGDFFATPRSEWSSATQEERPYDVEATLRYFEEQNEAYAAGTQR